MKLLHSADWHLDAPILGRTPEQTQLLRQTLLQIPGKIAALCKEHDCQLLLLSGDLFDGAYTRDSYLAVYQALKEVAIPVFISPGNHDYVQPSSPWLAESWPENVHIFREPAISSVALPQLDCRIYGAGFTAMDQSALLEGFAAEGPETYRIGVFHGDPTQTYSPYCPITTQQVKLSGLQYLALGHIHKTGAFAAGNTLCAWPGCPAGHGYDEDGQKGVLLVTVDQNAATQFLPLDSPRFFDLQVDAEEDAAAAVTQLLPPVGNQDFYRITLTGSSEAIDLAALKEQFAHFPNLELRDMTTLPVDIWSAVGEESFEGTFFRLLQESMEGQDPHAQEQITLAARICRKILDGQEVKLP